MGPAAPAPKSAPFQRHSNNRLPMATWLLLLVAPAVLAAAALRSRGSGQGRSGPGS